MSIKIKVTVQGKEVELTVEEAKNLFNELKEVFGEEKGITLSPTPYIPYVPGPQPYIPYVPYKPYDPYEPWHPYTPYVLWTSPVVEPYITWGVSTESNGTIPSDLCIAYNGVTL